MSRPVIAGTDFSPAGQAAVDYAAEFAARHNAPLRIIHAHLNPVAAYTGIGMPIAYIPGEDAVVDWIDTQLKQTAENLHGTCLRLTHIDARRIAGNPAQVLVDASTGALVTVVGCRGIGGFEELLLGSVSSQVATHAHGPVIVVRPPAADDGTQPTVQGPVLAAYDGSPAARAALEFAAAEAHTRNTRLVVAHVYWAEPWLDTEESTRLIGEAEQVAAQGITYVRDRYPALETETRVISSISAEEALTDASRDTSLVVVGCRGRGGFAGMLLGSASRTLTHHAHCPVAVIHPTEH